MLMTAGAAQAMDFKDNGPDIWRARAQMIIDASLSGKDGASIIADQKAACSGTFGELMSIGAKAPLWAVESVRSFCRGIDGAKAGRFNRNTCNDFKGAAKYLEKATPEKYPADIVETATTFRKVVLAEYEAFCKR